MELTKEQLQKIDNRLKMGGIKYWDLRLEMIDHIASDLEKNADTNDFKTELNNSFKRIGWQGNLKYLNTEGWQNVNKKYRKEYKDQIWCNLKQHLTWLLFLLFAIANYFLAEQFSYNTFKKINFSCYLITLIPVLIFSVKLGFKKYGKSVHLDYGIFYFSFATLMVSLPIQFLNYFDSEYQKLWLSIILFLFMLTTYSGYHVFKISLQRVEKMKREMAL